MCIKHINLIEFNKLYEMDSLKGITKSNKIKRFKELCNKLNIRDTEGKALAVDNVFGWRTRNCIASLPVLRKGSKGEAVEFVQEIVNAVPVDGSFGLVTEKCVKEYQSLNKLKVDGIVGQETWGAIVTN